MAKVGDKVKIVNNDGNLKHWLVIGSEGEIVRILDNDEYFIEGTNTLRNNKIQQRLKSKQFTIITNTKTETMKKQKFSTNQERQNAVLTVASELAGSNNNCVTTLELKLALEEKYPDVQWDQYDNGSVEGVTTLFYNLVRKGNFRSVANNGTFQVYADTSLPMPSRNDIANVPILVPQTVTKTVYVNKNKPVVPVASSPAAKLLKAIKKAVTPTPKVPASGTIISRTKALELLKDSKGAFVTVVFKKKDGTIRTLNGQYSAKIQPTIGLGLVTLRESSKAKKTPNDSLRQFNINELISLRTKGTTHIIRK